MRNSEFLVSNAMLVGDTSHSSLVDIHCVDGRIAAIVDSTGSPTTASSKPEQFDAGGRSVCASFIDTHQHLQKAALARQFSIDFLEASPKNVHDVLELVRTACVGRQAGEWIRGDSLDHRQLEEARFPNRLELDSVSPKNPVVILGRGNHALAANTIALEIADINFETVDPPGGRVERFDDGSPSGVLWELGKLRLDPNRVDTVLPVYGLHERMMSISAVGEYLLSNGITSVHDIVMDATEVRSYVRLHNEGKLPFRVQLLLRGLESKIPLEAIVATGLEQGFGDQFLKVGGVKFSIDGAESSNGAAIYGSYPGDAENHGLIRIEQAELDDAISRCHEAGIRAAVHAIGQRAVDMALESFEKAFQLHGRGKVRHRIEHAYFPPLQGQLARIREANLIVSTQPAFLWHTDAINEDHVAGLPEEMYPLRSMLDMGITVIGNSDFPVVSPNPWLGIAAAVTRQNRAGNSYGDSESVSVVEALRMYTSAAAFSGYEEAEKGSIEVGMLADMIVLDRNPFTIPPSSLSEVRVDATVLDGKVVFEREL